MRHGCTFFQRLRRWVFSGRWGWVWKWKHEGLIIWFLVVIYGYYTLVLRCSFILWKCDFFSDRRVNLFLQTYLFLLSIFFALRPHNFKALTLVFIVVLTTICWPALGSFPLPPPPLECWCYHVYHILSRLLSLLALLPTVTIVITTTILIASATSITNSTVIYANNYHSQACHSTT